MSTEIKFALLGEVHTILPARHRGSTAASVLHGPRDGDAVASDDGGGRAHIRGHEVGQRLGGKEPVASTGDEGDGSDYVNTPEMIDAVHKRRRDVDGVGCHVGERSYEDERITVSPQPHVVRHGHRNL